MKEKNMSHNILTQLDPLEQHALLALKDSVKQVFVTGAGGFLGSALCRRLLAADIKVVGFARGDYPLLTQLGVEMKQGDIANLQQLTQAMEGCDLVFHVAAKAGVWGDSQEYFSANVSGAQNVITACLHHKIDKLIYTSTPSVTFAGVDEEGIDESAPYAKQFLNSYGESKAVAELMMLQANGEQLATTCLRPHLIWGPNDPHLIPRVLARAKAGRLKLVGLQDKLVDTIYIDNAAYGHILAALDLTQARHCAGRCYFLSNDEPITMAQMLNKILASGGLPPVTKRVPANLAYWAGALLEFSYRLLKKQDEPIMTRFVAKQLSTSHFFDISAAKRDLGYQPLISIDEGMKRLKQSLLS